MTTKDMAINVFNGLNESQLLDFIRMFADDNTLALLESDIIARNPDRKHYNNFQELLDEINEELDDE